jgi:hypothetical protein
LCDSLNIYISIVAPKIDSVNYTGRGSKNDPVCDRTDDVLPGIDEINLRRASVRQRRVPVTRREDFLW